MTKPAAAHHTLGDNAARQLANATKTTAQLSTISPRWLTHLLQWVPARWIGVSKVMISGPLSGIFIRLYEYCK